jgi:hypothetical protein
MEVIGAWMSGQQQLLVERVDTERADHCNEREEKAGIDHRIVFERKLKFAQKLRKSGTEVRLVLDMKGNIIGGFTPLAWESRVSEMRRFVKKFCVHCEKSIRDTAQAISAQEKTEGIRNS